MRVIVLLFVGMFLFSMGLVSAQEATATVCCEQTTSGAFCQNVPQTECRADARQVPTSCDSTSYCKPGTCYDSSEGTCLDNTPQIVCNANGGTWSEESPPQCALGCCVLGDQAAFVSLVRCKKLSGFLGLVTNYRTDITNEVACIEAVQTQDKGACVYEFEFEKTCKFTTRAECEGSVAGINGTISNGEFHKDKLCSAEELGTNCGPSDNTMCMPGKDEVYYVDTCGNPANIYDASKLKDKEYWTTVRTKAESCNPLTGNLNNPNCGNCNYLQGSYCRSESSASASATYGDFICADLNCEDTSNGKSYKHGESWCVYEESPNQANNKVGSRFFKHICINGDEVLEACEDYRAEECIQDVIQTSVGPFSQAACRVNRWQDCLAQTDQQDCENFDRRDCLWRSGVSLNGTTPKDDAGTGLCLPKNTPGLNFWNSAETKAICGQGNKACIVKYEKGLFGGEKCVENCECLDPEWTDKYANVCMALGDCGPKVNWADAQGYKKGYQTTLEKLKKADGEKSGGLFG